MQQPIYQLEDPTSTYRDFTVLDGMAEEPQPVTEPISLWLVAGAVFGLVTMALILYALWSPLQAFQI